MGAPAAAPATPPSDVRARLARGELVRDGSRAVYRYHQVFEHGGRRVPRKMLLAAMRLVPWAERIVRPHEATDPAARADAIAGVVREAAHNEAVLAGYRDAAREVDRLLRPVEDTAPALEVTTPDGTQHRLWRVTSAEVIGALRPLFAPKKLHVLDGHARYEGMLAYAEQLAPRAATMYSSAGNGLACLVNLEDPALVVAARHRVVRAAGVTRAAVLDAAGAQFLVEKLPGAARDVARISAALGDTVAHQPAFAVAFAGEGDAWKLTLRPDVSPTAAGVAVHRAVQKYDPVVVEGLFAAHLPPGATIERTVDAGAALAKVAAGAELAIVMRPLALDQVLHADELGQVLPFGSTAFPPALANLVMYLVEPDEDLV
jgi:uncharacterized protein (DUF1015 family)